MTYSLEAWTLPGSTPHEEVVKEVLWESASFGQRLNGGDVSCFVEVSADYDRLDHLCDPDSNVETLVRCYRDGTYLTSWFARQRQRSHTHAERITVSGPGIDTCLDTGIVFPYDTPDPVPTGRFQSKQPDWVYGAGTQLLANPSFEDANGTTSWETGDSEGWELTEQDGLDGLTNATSELTQVIATANAQTGTHAFTIPAHTTRQHGIQKRFSCEPGGRYQLTVGVLSFTAGRRVTMFMTVEPGYNIHHTNGWFYRGTVGAELDNDPRNTGATNGATYQTISLDVTVGDDQTSFVVVIMDDHLSPGASPD